PRGDDRERALPLTGLRLPGLVEPGHEHEVAVRAVDPVRLAMVFRALPLVEAGGGDDAAAPGVRVSKGRTGGERFGASVDGTGGARGVLRPRVDEAPLRPQELT